MMTLKVWNSLSSETRKEILSYWYIEPEKCPFTRGLIDEYHHNFDYDDNGKRLKNILDCCYLRPSDKKIIISMEVSPIFADRYEQKNAAKVAKATKKKNKNTL